MTVFEGLCLLLALLTLVLASVNTLRARRFLRTGENSDTDVVTYDDEGKGQLRRASVLAAWNKLPRSAISGFWTYLMLPVLFLGMCVRETWPRTACTDTATAPAQHCHWRACSHHTRPGRLYPRRCVWKDDPRLLELGVPHLRQLPEPGGEHLCVGMSVRGVPISVSDLAVPTDRHA